MKTFWIFFILLASFSLNAAPPFAGPPPEAISACDEKVNRDACSFIAPHGQITGTCLPVPGANLACVPTIGIPPASTTKTADIARTNPSAKKVTSLIPDTAQGSCFNDVQLIDCPIENKDFFGQDAQYEGATPNYQDNGDGTVSDLVTGLVWQQAHNQQRITWQQAEKQCSDLTLGGYQDWRLPTIKELFSIADFSGATGRRPFLAPVFEISPPDPSILKNDRFAATHHVDMMGQTWSSTIYSGDHWGKPGVKGVFFFNFLDGRIKQAPMGGSIGLFYRCVRGSQWGSNLLVDNNDGTITDKASQLMWQQADDGNVKNWQSALAYCENLELAGHADWRLPNIKELQSIVDYRYHAPAIDQTFFKQEDAKGWFWSSTTHGENPNFAAYICFGKCISVDGVDVHGAGAQRSDPKTGNASLFTSGLGGQKDQVRINNYVRCVR